MTKQEFFTQIRELGDRFERNPDSMQIRAKNGECPIVALANSKWPGRFWQENSMPAANKLGLDEPDHDDIVWAADSCFADDRTALENAIFGT